MAILSQTKIKTNNSMKFIQLIVNDNNTSLIIYIYIHIYVGPLKIINSSYIHCRINRISWTLTKAPLMLGKYRTIMYLATPRKYTRSKKYTQMITKSYKI